MPTDPKILAQTVVDDAAAITADAAKLSTDAAKLAADAKALQDALQPPPTFSFSATPASITAGDTVTITWSSTNMASAVGVGNSTVLPAGQPVALSGNLTDKPTANTSYGVSWKDASGTVYNSTVVNVTVAPAVIPNLTGYWKFDGDAVDSSAGASNGTIFGAATFAAGRVGQAIVLSGSSQYVTLDKAASTFFSSSAWTMSMWLNPSGTAATPANAYSGQGATSDNNGYLGIARAVIGGSDRIWVFNWDGSEKKIGVPYTAGQWCHVVATLGGGTLSIYKDGALVGSVPSGATASLASSMLIGSGYALAWGGSIDDVRFYNRALTTTEIQQIYTSTGGAAADTTPPSVATTKNVSGTASGDVLFTFTFSEPVTGFTAAKVTVTNGTKGTFSTVNSSTYTLVVTPPANASGNMTVAVPAGAAADLAGNQSTAAATVTQPFDTTVPSGTRVPLTLSLDLGGGRTMSFSESSATNLGNYSGPFVQQRCLRQVSGAMVVDFRPDVNGARDEIVIELGSLYNFGAQGTNPTTASGQAPAHIGVPPTPVVTAPAGSPSNQAGTVILSTTYVDASGKESAGSYYYYWTLVAGTRLTVASPPAQGNATLYHVYASYYGNDGTNSSGMVRQTSQPVSLGTNWAAPNAGLLLSGTVVNSTTRTSYVAYRATISGGKLSAPVTVDVPVHYWGARWRWQSAPRPIVRSYNDLLAMKAILPLAEMPGINTDAMAARAWEGPMGKGPVEAGMPNTGERDDIGFTTEWTAQYLLRNDPNAEVCWRAAAEATGTMPFWVRDSATGALADFVAHPYVAYNDAVGGYQFPSIPLATGYSSFSLDAAHMPSCALVPYLLTDDPYFLEGAQATTNFGTTDQNYSSWNTKIPGVITGQPRTMAWGWRDVFQSALATPASTPGWLLPQSYFKTKLVQAQLTYGNRFIANTSSPCTAVFKFMPLTTTTTAFMLDYICVVAGWIKWTGMFPEFDAVVNYASTPRVAMSDPTDSYGWNHQEPEPYYMPVVDARKAPNCTGDPEQGYNVVPNPDTPATWQEFFQCFARMGQANGGHIGWTDPATWPTNGDLARPFNGYLPWVRAALAALTLGNVTNAQRGHDWLKLQLDKNPLFFGAKWAIKSTTP
jgi:hypothetical protein